MIFPAGQLDLSIPELGAIMPSFIVRRKPGIPDTILSACCIAICAIFGFILNLAARDFALVVTLTLLRSTKVPSLIETNLLEIIIMSFALNSNLVSTKVLNRSNSRLIFGILIGKISIYLYRILSQYLCSGKIINGSEEFRLISKV